MVKGWYGHSVISRVVPSGIGMTRHAMAAQLLGEGACEPPGDLSSTPFPIGSACHHGFSFCEHGTSLLCRRDCLRVPGQV